MKFLRKILRFQLFASTLFFNKLLAPEFKAHSTGKKNKAMINRQLDIPACFRVLSRDLLRKTT